LDGAPVGWNGWARFELDLERVETTTFLAEALWGTGLYRQLLALNYQVSALGPRQLVFSVNERNARSLAALGKSWPGMPHERVWEPGAQRHSIVCHPHGPPRAYVPWSDDVAGPLGRTVADLDVPYALAPPP
jgi:hypothetical protein